MWSASSSTVISTASSEACPLRRWSSSRPGQATSTSTPAARPRTCGAAPTPPKTTSVRRPSAAASGAIAASIWLASSRVGARISARGRRALRRLAGGGETRQQRQCERVRLAGAGAAAAEHVPAGQRVRQGGGLDRERGGDAEAGERRGEGGRHAELGEGRHVAGTPKGGRGCPSDQAYRAGRQATLLHPYGTRSALNADHRSPQCRVHPPPRAAREETPQMSGAPTVDRRREDVVQEHMPLVGHLVREMLARVPAHVNRDDLMSAGYAALVHAARGFDAARGVPFARFAAARVRGALLDELRGLDWASRSVRQRARRTDSAPPAADRRAGPHAHRAGGGRAARLLGRGHRDGRRRRAPRRGVQPAGLRHGRRPTTWSPSRAPGRRRC